MLASWRIHHKQLELRTTLPEICKLIRISFEEKIDYTNIQAASIHAIQYIYNTFWFLITKNSWHKSVPKVI